MCVVVLREREGKEALLGKECKRRRTFAILPPPNFFSLFSLSSSRESLASAFQFSSFPFFSFFLSPCPSSSSVRTVDDGRSERTTVRARLLSSSHRKNERTKEVKPVVVEKNRVFKTSHLISTLFFFVPGRTISKIDLAFFFSPWTRP